MSAPAAATTTSETTTSATTTPSTDAAQASGAAPTLSDLRHDLRTPVGNIIGYAEMLLEDAGDTGNKNEIAGDLNRVVAAAKRLLAMIDERLSDQAFARLGVGGGVAATADVARPNAPAATETRNSAPRAAETTVALAAVPAAQAPQKEHGLLLVVDDIEQNRDLLARRLERLGHEVVTAGDGPEALGLLAGGGFDLVLLDIMMPGMDGYEVLRRIKEDSELRHTPVLMVSALDENDSVIRCIELGAADYLNKPVDPVLLRARVGACLRDKRAYDREAGLFEELQRNYKRLQELERLRDDLTSMIVHDLRTPLTSLLSGLQTLPMLGDLNPDQAEFVGIAVEGGKTLLSMINDLLDIDKMESGSLVLEYGALRPADLVERALAQVAMLAKNKGLALAAELAPDLPAFEGDEDKLRRTLVNLLGNALKFTNKGSVTVGARRAPADPANVLQFYVRDTGEGIPREAFGRIFEKFGQVEDRKAGRKNSTGLGLTFCKMAVEAHGGVIGVESEMGVGSTFSFTIPVKRSAPAIAA